MDIVRLLPDSVANQIAAGEVIQRPASCLKELVENSLDAGATYVQIIVRDAGRTLLQVADDGQGMSETDARMAFERHATSKIAQASDLFALHTMGFRGEALASICAVANVEVQTRREEDELGTLIEISGSQVLRQEPVQCAKGTNMRVKNLFFNVPARRRFLKTDQTEMRNIMQEFFRIVLVNPQVRFTLIHNDETLWNLKAGTDKQRIETVFGRGSRNPYSRQLIDIQSESELVTIHGFVGLPEAANKNPQQYFFVNKRFMRHPYFHKAVMTAYQGLLHGDSSPSYFIYFDINPEAIDVNIHPTKTEIKFADEQLIFPILLATVREALGKFNIVPSIDFDTAGKIEMPVFRPDSNIPVPSDFLKRDTSYNPFRSTHSGDVQRNPIDRNWQTLYTPLEEQQIQQLTSAKKTTAETLFEQDYTDTLQGIPYQLAGKYIVQPTTQGLLLIDQHRAHALLLYDQCRKRLNEHNGEVQQLLFPEIWDVGIEDEPLVEANKTYFHDLGFDLSPITRGSYNVTGVPVLVGNQNELLVLQQILDSIRETGPAAGDERERHIAWAMAKSAAMPYGRPLTEDEMTNIVAKLMQKRNFRLTPSGKTIAVLLNSEMINNLF
ncbi:MAG: DNA mismatch repair endonuclease MutL [Paludibacteraceae bacterium]|nr:DNA mismatch repair endonuclease MutL [Paludibacteraceae bacterium]